MRLSSIYIKRILFVAIALITFSSCATYHQKNAAFYQNIYNGNFEEAETVIDADKKLQNGRNKLLYNLDKGVVTHMLGKHAESIAHFKEADIIIEDTRKNIGTEALALLTNPMAKPYMPEDFEVIMINFYQALNYIALNQWDEAIVECKRANIKLNRLNDKHKDHKNRYQRDAFAHLLMGLIYDAQGDANNAFIAYRNAFEVYETDYPEQFNVGLPEQLKYDLIRTADKTGFKDQVDFFQNKFGIESLNNQGNHGELVFFWLNGFGPVKAEWGLTFTNSPGDLGWLTFHSEDMGMDFPFFIGDLNSRDQRKITNMEVTRITFPKYVPRLPVFNEAYISVNDSLHYPIYEAENINEIAFKVLQDRMVRELGNALLRLALKEAVQNIAENEDKTLGFFVSLANAITEKADTRNWQTLPHSISYTRISLPPGEHELHLNVVNDAGVQKQSFKVNIVKNKTQFLSNHTIDSFIQ
jgi:hypothetical protein